MASMRGATRVRRTIQQVRTHFPVLHPSRSAYTHTPRSRDAARTTACSEPWQTSPSTMLIPTRTARSFECRGASSPVAPRLRPDNPAARAATRASQHGADHEGGAHRPVRMLPHSYPHPRRRPLPGAQRCWRARARHARPPGGPPFPSARGIAFPPGVPYSHFWSRWFPDQRTEPKTQLLRLASVKNYKSYVIFELPLRFFELSPRNKEHQRLGVSRYSLVYVYCFFAQLRKFLKLRLPGNVPVFTAQRSRNDPDSPKPIIDIVSTISIIGFGTFGQ